MNLDFHKSNRDGLPLIVWAETRVNLSTRVFGPDHVDTTFH